MPREYGKLSADLSPIYLYHLWEFCDYIVSYIRPWKRDAVFAVDVANLGLVPGLAHGARMKLRAPPQKKECPFSANA